MSALTQLPAPLYLARRPAIAADAAFGFATAGSMAWASQLAYETNASDKLRGILAAWNWEFCTIFAGRICSVLPLTSAKGYIARCNGIAILAFSGTEPTSLADWIVDFSIHQNADGVHDGFEQGFRAVETELVSELGPGGAYGDAPILITGHSLGGALAGVAALRFVTKSGIANQRILGVYTYGMPRVGDVNFASDYGTAGLHERTYRFVDGDDIVPQIPPSQNPFTFRHVGRVKSCTHLQPFTDAAPGPYAAETLPPGQEAVLTLAQALLPQHVADGPPFPGVSWARLVVDALPPPIRDHILDRYLAALGVFP
jgi:triacylglycerol lipase